MASQRSPSGPEMENINPSQDLVSFEGVAPSYCPYEDILVRYRLGEQVSPTRQDWVGLFQSGWGTTEDYLTYVWAPRTSCPDKRVVTFPANQLQALATENRTFQFLFLSRGTYVAGVSRVFHLSGGEVFSERRSLSCLTLSDKSSFTLVGSDISIDSQGFENVADLVEKTPTLTESFEMACKSSSSFQLAQLFEIPDEQDKLEVTTSAIVETNIPDQKESTASAKRSSKKISKKLKKQKKQKIKNIRKVNRDSQTLVGSFIENVRKVNRDSQTLAGSFTENIRKVNRDSQTLAGSFAENIRKVNRDSQTLAASFAENIRKVNRDSQTLAGSFTEKKSLEDQLCIVPQHPIVTDFMATKETSLVPYVSVFNLQMSNDQHNNKECVKRNLKRDMSMSPLNFTSQCPSWIHLELAPTCCALCTAARSLMKVYRRQLSISTTNLKEIKLDVVSLRTELETKEEQISEFKEMEIKHKITDETIKEVLIQMSCLKNDISNLLLQNNMLENERNQLKQDLDCCQNDMFEVQTKYTNAEVQLNDVLFSLSLKGYGGLIDSTGKKINLAEIDGEPTDVDGWQLYKNKRCGRLLAIINQQERSIKTLQASVSDKEESGNNLKAEVADNRRLLQMAKTQVGSLMDEVIQLKGSLDSSRKREELHLREMANAEVEINQYKYEAESRQHHLLRQIHELKETLSKKSENTVIASTHRLVSNGLAKVSDVCKTTWCAGLCPTIGKSPRSPAAIPLATTTNDQPKYGCDTISWENEEEPVAKQPKFSVTKKACKRAHTETEAKEKPMAKGVHHRRRTNFPTSCPVCGISFASAVDSRVIDEHLAFHDVYRV